MKIVHICLAAFYIDNYSYQENLLPKYHKKAGNEVSIIASLLSFDSNGKSTILDSSSRYLNENEIIVNRLDYKIGKKIGRFLRVYKNTYSVLEAEKPDIIFIHGTQFIDVNQIIKYIKRNPTVKVFADNHADFSNSATNWISKNFLHGIIWRYYTKKLEPYTKTIFGVLPARVDFLKNVYKVRTSKINLLPMGADDEKVDWENRNNYREEIRDNLNIDDSQTVLLTGGKIDNSKKEILSLMKVINNFEGNVKLIIFGSVITELKTEFNSLLSSPNIIFLGWVEPENLYGYFHASDIGIFPGRHSVIWEQAVGAGLPCAFKYWEGLEHLNHNDNIRFMVNTDEKSLQTVIEEMLNYGYLETLKNNAVSNTREKFLYSNIAAKSLGE